MTNYVLALGRGFDDAGRPLMAVAEADDRDNWIGPARGVMADLVVAAEAVPADPEPSERSLGIHKSKDADQAAAAAIREAAAEETWVLLVGARGMPDGEDGIRIAAQAAFLPGAGFDPLSSRDVAHLCSEMIDRHFGKELPRGQVFASRPMIPATLWHHVAEERARQEPHEAIIWVRRDGLAVCAAHRGSYLFWRAGEFGPEARDCGFDASAIPTEPGFHYFSGRPWSCHGSPANDWEYDDGIEGAFEPLQQGQLARFGVTWESLKEEVREYEEELEEEANPAPSSSAA